MPICTFCAWNIDQPCSTNEEMHGCTYYQAYLVGVINDADKRRVTFLKCPVPFMTDRNPETKEMTMAMDHNTPTTPPSVLTEAQRFTHAIRQMGLEIDVDAAQDLVNLYRKHYPVLTPAQEFWKRDPNCASHLKLDIEEFQKTLNTQKKDEWYGTECKVMTPILQSLADFLGVQVNLPKDES